MSSILRKPSKCRAKPAQDLMGNGRYFYVKAPGNGHLYIFDSTLLASGNYVGAGVWTIDPLIATINTVINNILYVGLTRKVVSDSQFIDADPTSPNFNTIVGTYSIPTATVSKAYDFINHRVLHGCINSLVISKAVDMSNVIARIDQTYGVGRSRVSFFDHLQEGFLVSDETSGTDFLPSVRDNNRLREFKPFAYGFVTGANQAQGYIFAAGNYLFRLNNGTILFYDRRTNLYVGSITVANSRGCRPGYSRKYNRFITGNVFSNSFGFFKLDTLTGDGSVAKGSVDTNEAGTRDIVANDDVALAMATSIDANNQKRLHAIDMGTKGYIGYYDLPANALGNFSALYYASHWMCKNQIEHWDL